MRRTDALQNVLEGLTRTFSKHNRTVPVRFDEQPHADADGDYVAVAPNVRDTYGRDVERALEMRLIVDTLSHEMAHINHSDLTAKQGFADEHPECPKLAGQILNAVEDAYIDHKRIQKYPGLAKARALSADMLMANHHRRPRVDSMDSPNAEIETLIQVLIARRAKGIEDDNRLRRWAGVVAAHLERAEDAATQADRVAVAESLLTALKRVLPDGTTGEAADEYIEDADMPPMVEGEPSGEAEAGEIAEDGQVPGMDESPDAEGEDGEAGEAGADGADGEAGEGGADGAGHADTGEGADADGPADADADADAAEGEGAGGADGGVRCPECGGNADIVGGDA